MLIIIYSCCWRWGEGKAKTGYIRRTGRDGDGEQGGGRPGLIANRVYKKIGNHGVGGRGCLEEVKGP